MAYCIDKLQCNFLWGGMDKSVYSIGQLHSMHSNLKRRLGNSESLVFNKALLREAVVEIPYRSKSSMADCHLLQFWRGLGEQLGAQIRGVDHMGWALETCKKRT